MAKTKIFKSGNSMAVRLPASFKAVPGTVVEVREAQGQWIVEPVGESKRYIDVASFYGLCPEIEPITDRSFDERPSEHYEREQLEAAAREQPHGGR